MTYISRDLNLDIGSLIELRRWLHAHPELSRQEVKTAAYMRNYLQEHAPPDRVVDLAGAGFVAIYDSGFPGPTVLVRTELDALPIHEINADLAYRSTVDGVAHKCGHDGHMTVMAGVAQLYARKRPFRGRVVLLFQPDEETGTGARECCNHPNFEQIKPDYVFALHNFPGFPEHQILCRDGTFTSAVKFVALKFTGKEAHSAMPETGVSPASTICEITQSVKGLQDRFSTSDQPVLIVPVHFNMGVSSSGVAPGYGEAHFTLRAARNDTVRNVMQALLDQAEEIAKSHGLELGHEVIEDFAATCNDEHAVAMVRDAAKLNGVDYHELPEPFRAGEDFGEITSQYQGAMFGLGAGMNMPALHHPDYDFPDEIIPTGIAMFKSLIEQALLDC